MIETCFHAFLLPKASYKLLAFRGLSLKTIVLRKARSSFWNFEDGECTDCKHNDNSSYNVLTSYGEQIFLRTTRQFHNLRLNCLVFFPGGGGGGEASGEGGRTL
jgi:hypothetical protein